MQRSQIRYGVLAFFLALSLGLGAAGLAQVGVGPGTLYLGTVPTSGSQSTVRVNTGVTPNRTEVGCETDRLNTATVNCVRVVGAATGANPTISAIAATGGDANIGVTVNGLGTGAVSLARQSTNYVTVTPGGAGVNPIIAGAGEANTGVTLNPAGTGTVVLGGVHTTFTTFYPAVTHCVDDHATPIAVTRVAANDWALVRTAGGAETHNITCTFPLPFRTTASKGVRLDSFAVSEFISVVALTSNTFNALATTTYVNATANAVAGYGGAITITPPTATQATPYLTAATIGTPAFMNTADAQVSIDFTVVMANTGVYRLYGIAVRWSTALY